MGVIVPPASATHPERAVPTLSRVIAMTTWEYLTAPLLIHNTKQILDNFGADGWELVQIVNGPDGTSLAAYVPVVRDGNLVFTSGQLPMVDGRLAATGKVGAEVDEATAKELAATCAL